MATNLWQLIMSIYKFIIDVFETFSTVWNFEFTIGNWTFKFPEMLTTVCIVLLVAMFIKKFIPIV